MQCSSIKVRPIIEEHCMKDQGWFRSPRLTFVFDDTLERSKNIEALFAKIAKEKKDES
jgi:ribosome-binding factor A